MVIRGSINLVKILPYTFAVYRFSFVLWQLRICFFPEDSPSCKPLSPLLRSGIRTESPYLLVSSKQKSPKSAVHKVYSPLLRRESRWSMVTSGE